MMRTHELGERLSRLIRRPRPFLAVAVPVALPFLLATVSFQTPARTINASAVTPPLRYTDLAPSPTQLPEHSIIITIEDGDTLDEVLQTGGLSRSESAQLNNEMGHSVDLRRLRPGNLVRFHLDTAGSVDSVELKLAGWGEIDAVRNGDKFDVTPHEAQQREIETIVSATISTSLWEALTSAGESPQLVQQLVDVFQWDVDFFALQAGDSFSVIVKKRFAGSDLVGYGPITAARFQHDGDTYEAFRSEAGDGHAGYYSRIGTPLRKQFLRAPLQFSRITSGFSKRRYHPLLHYFRPHHGVDYGAPVGTPVMTTADGVVLDATYNRGEGNFVRIRHSSRIETSYLHLSRFAKGIRRGKQVAQGDVIGYVGMTGLATGPHLDYRVSDGGTWLDPLKLKSITPDPLRGVALAEFRANVSRLLPRLASQNTSVAQVAAKRRALF
jgi:murein DD-endopeptidase MepM/ murein hydrolase activator NlpD